MANNVVVCEEDVLMYVVLSKVQRYVPYGEIACTTECTTLQQM